MNMKYTIENTKYELEVLNEKKKLITSKGFAFMDEEGKCMIIVYGNGHKDTMINYLENNDVK